MSFQYGLSKLGHLWINKEKSKTKSTKKQRLIVKKDDYEGGKILRINATIWSQTFWNTCFELRLIYFKFFKTELGKCPFINRFTPSQLWKYLPTRSVIPLTLVIYAQSRGSVFEQFLFSQNYLEQMSLLWEGLFTFFETFWNINSIEQFW